MASRGCLPVVFHLCKNLASCPGPVYTFSQFYGTLTNRIRFKISYLTVLTEFTEFSECFFSFGFPNKLVNARRCTLTFSLVCVHTNVKSAIFSTILFLHARSAVLPAPWMHWILVPHFNRFSLDFRSHGHFKPTQNVPGGHRITFLQ